MSLLRLSILAALIGCAPWTAMAQQAVPAVLQGHAVLRAASFVAPPADAPADLKVSGKYTSGVRVEALGSVMGRSAERPTGIALPVTGQVRQGHSGVKVMPDGTVWVLTDNGFGSKANSMDAMLYLNRYRVDWQAGTLAPQDTVFLRDPDRKIPFRIIHEDSAERYLTGSDLDTESFQPIGEHFWIGDEFGPYLLKTDRSGKVLALFETQIDGRIVRSPDHHAVATPGAPGQTYRDVTLKRSKGFEGMAASRDGQFLYPLLEGPLWNEQTQTWEQVDGKTVLRILEFSVADERWTGRYWLYPLEGTEHAIGDFNMIDTTTGLVIERDNGEGTPDKACAPGADTQTCFSNLPRFKRVYKIEFSEANVGKAVRKLAYVDLLAIQDPDRKARKPLTDGVLQFPFFTIENVDVVDADHIIVGNDNNFPFSSSREPNRQDDNEFVLLRTPELLRSR
ncbi:MAG: esterase-like activity of phytase family protein [Castellaniella sp.]|uniref:esterase-like activity of phytase family protein n=1 Tax=Castellaniella sp. TaxID=1955812 RepID=UPI002A36AEAE|nr:esterase-like activity of phytase family protein [Castellaniella sp.]MDY0309028.1 esterase-like activity of phytase family protein [Castellaniella sp.]